MFTAPSWRLAVSDNRTRLTFRRQPEHHTAKVVERGSLWQNRKGLRIVVFVLSAGGSANRVTADGYGDGQ